MKNKALLLTAFILFLIINTSYYWESLLGHFTFLIYLLLAIAYIIVTILLVKQIIFAIKEKFSDRIRTVNIGAITLLLTLIFIKPFGLINFGKFESNSIFIAQTEGAANCSTILKLKDDFTFRERNVCFGINEINGKYHIKNDTIFFQSTNTNTKEEDFYEFAIIKKSEIYNSEKQIGLVQYKNSQDTTGRLLVITKNDIAEFKAKTE